MKDEKEITNEIRRRIEEMKKYCDTAEIIEELENLLLWIESRG